MELAKALEGRWEDVREIGTIDPALDTEDPATRFRRLPPALLRPHAQKMELPLERHLKLGLVLPLVLSPVLHLIHSVLHLVLHLIFTLYCTSFTAV